MSPATSTQPGNSIVVKTLPGTGGTQTIVNALGGLVAANKRLFMATTDGKVICFGSKQ